MKGFSAGEKLDEVERELELRSYVFPRLIEQGTISSDEASRWISILEAIRDDYLRKLEEEKAAA